MIYVPSLDSVQEAKIQTNGFTAQYGWSTGNVYNVVTRSGSSSVHGDAFEFLRNDKLDANFFFSNANGIPKAPFHRNQFGIAGGGPVYIPRLYQQRNKTFFFAVYEGLRQSSPVAYPRRCPLALRETEISPPSSRLSTIPSQPSKRRMGSPGLRFQATRFRNL